jgi:hypothetical protein
MKRTPILALLGLALATWRPVARARRARKTSVAAALSLVVALGCAPREADGYEPWPEAELTVIHVQNMNTNQATIYMQEDGGFVRRLGTVQPLNERFFEAQLRAGTSVSFEVRLFGGRRHRTDSVLVTPGDTIEVTVPVRL